MIDRRSRYNADDIAFGCHIVEGKYKHDNRDCLIMTHTGKNDNVGGQYYL